MPLAGRDVYVAEGARTPSGRSHPGKGWFRDTHACDLLGAVYRGLLGRAGIAPGVVEDLVAGCTAPFYVELGLVTMCCGGGLGTGTLLQRV